jgi:hypothetical protein
LFHALAMLQLTPHSIKAWFCFFFSSQDLPFFMWFSSFNKNLFGQIISVRDNYSMEGHKIESIDANQTEPL